MYSYKQKIEAVRLYIRYKHKTKKVIKELGIAATARTIRGWYRLYTQTGSLPRKCMTSKYNQAQIDQAIYHYLTCGHNLKKTARCLGYPSLSCLTNWLKEIGYKTRILHQVAIEDKQKAVLELLHRNESAKIIADKYHTDRVTLYAWAKQLGVKISSKPTKKSTKNPPSKSTDKRLEKEIERLQKQIADLVIANKDLNNKIHGLELDNAIVVEIGKIIGNENWNKHDSRNRRKAMVINSLRKYFSLSELLSGFDLAKSSYFYQIKAMRTEHQDLELIEKIRDIFSKNYSCYGYRRIWLALKQEGIIVSEKVVRRIMKQENLIALRPKRRKYNSYAGEITPEVPNLLERNFHADKPNQKLVSDITEFSIPSGKVYLSPIIDCFDSSIVSYTIGRHPNAKLTNEMLEMAVKKLKGAKPIIHTDRGAHYRWPSWIKIMNEAGFVRSMSKKGYSPDNAACEGFFGRVKNEFFYGHDWSNISVPYFIKQLGNYLDWYSEQRIKLTLKNSIQSHRK